MLPPYTSSEENIPYLGKVAQNIRNNDEGLKLFEDTADWLTDMCVCKLVPDFVNSSPLSWSLNPPQEIVL